MSHRFKNLHLVYSKVVITKSNGTCALYKWPQLITLYISLLSKLLTGVWIDTRRLLGQLSAIPCIARADKRWQRNAGLAQGLLIQIFDRCLLRHGWGQLYWQELLGDTIDTRGRHYFKNVHFWKYRTGGRSQYRTSIRTDLEQPLATWKSHSEVDGTGIVVSKQRRLY